MKSIWKLKKKSEELGVLDNFMKDRKSYLSGGIALEPAEENFLIWYDEYLKGIENLKKTNYLIKRADLKNHLDLDTLEMMFEGYMEGEDFSKKSFLDVAIDIRNMTLQFYGDDAYEESGVRYWEGLMEWFFEIANDYVKAPETTISYWGLPE